MRKVCFGSRWSLLFTSGALLLVCVLSSFPLLPHFEPRPPKSLPHPLGQQARKSSPLNPFRLNLTLVTIQLSAYSFAFSKNAPFSVLLLSPGDMIFLSATQSQSSESSTPPYPPWCSELTYVVALPLLLASFPFSWQPFREIFGSPFGDIEFSRCTKSYFFGTVFLPDKTFIVPPPCTLLRVGDPPFFPIHRCLVAFPFVVFSPPYWPRDIAQIPDCTYLHD